eukprot:scaffold2239_cov114-Skeletonema_dohrnii-CCMP3373.AAC.14
MKFSLGVRLSSVAKRTVRTNGQKVKDSSGTGKDRCQHAMQIWNLDHSSATYLIDAFALLRYRER